MKEIVRELVDTLFNPKVIIQKNLDLKHECQVKFDKSLYLKDYLKSRAWLEFNRPIIYRSLESGIGSLLRDGLNMNETQIKAIIADMRGSLNQLVEMRHSIEQGEKAGKKLEGLK